MDGGWEMASEDAVVAPQKAEFTDDDLITPDEPAVESKVEPEPEPTAETPDAETVVSDAEPEPEPVAEATDAEPEATTEEPVAEEPRPGTPDKALQKVQQKESAIERKLDALLERLSNQTTPPTKEQVAQVKDLQQQHAEVKDELETLLEQKDADIDVFAASKQIAKSALETKRGVKTVADDVAALTKKIEALESENARQRQQSAWSDYEKSYPGVQVQTLWNETYADVAKRYAHLGQQAVLQFASDRFHEIAASKAKATTPKPAEPKPQPKPTQTATHKPTPTTRGGGQVTVKASPTKTKPADETPEQRRERLAAELLSD
jgi:hypothetical protein